jgi:hypothetical protein
MWILFMFISDMVYNCDIGRIFITIFTGIVYFKDITVKLICIVIMCVI